MTDPRKPDFTDWLGGIALFVALGGGMFLAWVTQ